MNPALRRPAPTIPAPLIGAALLLAAVAAGRFIASGRIGLSVGIVLAIPFFVLAFVDLAYAIAAWAALLFIADLTALSVGPTAIEILLVLAWLGAGGSRRGRLPVLRENTPLVVAILAYVTWLTLSAAWAGHPGAAFAQAGGWWQAVIMFLVVATTLTSSRDIRLVTFAFVIGSVVSVTIGLLGYGGPNGAARIAAVGDRLTGGGGDPNYQASAFVAAMFLAGGLVSVVSSRRAKLMLGFALAFITVGFIATQSRGGLIALAVAAVAALVLLPEQRRQVFTAVGVGALGVGVWVLIRHDALKRITDLGGGTSGRHDQWTVAWRIFKSHPFFGVGLNNFISLEPRYVLTPGTLTNVHLVAETPEVVHNSYLQLLAENGVVGLALFGVIVYGCLRASWLAIHRFEAVGDAGMAGLSRAVLIGTIGMLVANFFISDVDDFRLWILFALGPVLLTLANHRRPATVDAPAVPVRIGAPEARLDAPRSPPRANGGGVQLSPGDRAVLLLLMRQRKTFDEVASLLDMQPSRVRQRAHAAITAVGDASGPSTLSERERERICDYLLGQLSPRRSETVRELLNDSAEARRWEATVVRELWNVMRDERPAL